MQSQTNIYNLLPGKEYVDQQGVVFFEVSKSNLPLRGDFYVTHAAIILCDQGYFRCDYDFNPVELHAHDLCLLSPGYSVRFNMSDDYRARIIVMSEEFFNKTKYLNISHYNRHYSYIVANPVCSFTNEQYSSMSDAFNVLHAICSMCKEYRETMMLNLLHAIIMMRYNFCPIPTEAKKKRDNRISARFQEAVVEHYRESRDVAFYARMFGLSPKYFAVLVKKELHVSPGQWISNYVVMRAKEMLDKRGDLNIQQIALELGFDMQSAFSRFFKNYTGVTPKEYRK